MSQAGAEEAEQWFEEQIRMGRFRPGDAFPSERALSSRLCISRGAIREAKARLVGRGLLTVKQGTRTRFRRSDATAAFQDWLHQQPQEGSLGFRQRVKEVLAFQRLLLPDLLSSAVRVASAEALDEIHGLLLMLETGFTFHRSWEELWELHASLLNLAAHTTRNSVFAALASGLSESMRTPALWHVVVANAQEWQSLFHQAAELGIKRQSAKLKAFTQKQLHVLNQHAHVTLRRACVPGVPNQVSAVL